MSLITSNISCSLVLNKLCLILFVNVKLKIRSLSQAASAPCWRTPDSRIIQPGHSCFTSRPCPLSCLETLDLDALPSSKSCSPLLDRLGDVGTSCPSGPGPGTRKASVGPRLGGVKLTLGSSGEPSSWSSTPIRNQVQAQAQREGRGPRTGQDCDSLVDETLLQTGPGPGLGSAPVLGHGSGPFSALSGSVSLLDRWAQVSSGLTFSKGSQHQDPNPLQVQTVCRSEPSAGPNPLQVPSGCSQIFMKKISNPRVEAGP